MLLLSGLVTPLLPPDAGEAPLPSVFVPRADPIDSLLLAFPTTGLPIGAMRERLDCDPTAELLSDGEFV